MISEQNLREMSIWAGFLGIIMIISGVLSAIAGLFMFVVGAIPGIITIILGLKLRQAKQYADEMLQANNQEAINSLVASLSSFFKIQGILIIVIFVLAVISMLFGGLAFFAFMGM